MEGQSRINRMAYVRIQLIQSINQPMAFTAKSPPVQRARVVLKVVRVAGAAFSGKPVDHFFFTPLRYEIRTAAVDGRSTYW